MQVQLAENIRRYRREKKLTQEQLAEVMGVTVGTVSKWEAGASTPDVAVIMELADFFGTSVDVLLGYRQQSASLADTLERLRALRNAKQFGEGRRQAEKAVKQFPNSFEAVYHSASLLQMAGLEEQDAAAARRAEALYTRALELFEQNTDPEVTQVSIRNAMAGIAIQLGENDRGVELLKQNNVEGVNNVRIGQTLAQDPARQGEALEYLEKGLLDLSGQLIVLAGGYLNAAQAGGSVAPAEARALTMVVIHFLDELKPPKALSALEKYQVALWVGCAIMSEMQGLARQADADLHTAWTLADRYDAQPEAGAYTLRFIRLDTMQDTTSFDDFGRTAREGAEKMLRGNAGDCPRLLPLWEGFCHENEP